MNQENRRYTVTILVTEVNEHGEDIDNPLSIGPDFAHTDLERVEWIASILEEHATNLMEEIGSCTPLVLPEEVDPLYLQVKEAIDLTNRTMEELGLHRRYSVTMEGENQFMIHVVNAYGAVKDGRTEDAATMIHLLKGMADAARRSVVYFAGGAQ